MENIPTAEEFVLKDGDGYLAGDYTPREVYALMIEFAKLHVEAALKAAANKAVEIQKPTSRKYVSKKELKACYPLENIK